MTEVEKKQVAVFRYMIINGFVGGRRLVHGEQEKLLAEKCTHRWCIPLSGKNRNKPQHATALGTDLLE
ncbi:MAG: hypothetical protein PHF56_14470 [Desulfuromonadaceae bacterium]|nr:hypothetical protein [Desulfuromonadaceae bacterium]